MPGFSFSDKTSKSLLVRISRNEPDAWFQLVDLYSPLVASWCRGSGLSLEDTADVMQSVFLTVNRSFHQFQIESSSEQKTPGNRSCFRAWLWQITKSRIIDWIRRKEPAQSEGGSTAQYKLNHQIDRLTDPNNQEPTSKIQKQSLLGRAMAQIRPDFRKQTWAAFWMTVVEDKPTDIVAKELDLKPATVRQAKSRILRRLREQLGDL